MKRLGAFLIVIGIGSLILPQLGMQFRLMSSLESSQPAAGIVVAGIGVLFIVLQRKPMNAERDYSVGSL